MYSATYALDIAVIRVKRKEIPASLGRHSTQQRVTARNAGAAVLNSNPSMADPRDVGGRLTVNSPPTCRDRETPTNRVRFILPPMAS
jgi:hypothetical protein